MNFFERQRQLRGMSVRLVLLFAIAVIGIVVAVDLAVLIAFNAFNADATSIAGIVIVASLATAAAIGLAMLYRMATLRGGGGRVARELGGDYVPEDTADPQLRRLRNVVEEISIASGVPVPEIYVMQKESSINAFAAGWSTSDAAIAVTRGALERLNRDELQGVIAHEFSHVVNGDMRLNIRLMGLLFGILFLAIAGETMLRVGIFSRSRDERGGNNPLPIIGIALVAAGWIGLLVGRIIKASVSRQREYLADASAVQFTRQTTGLSGALKKIAGLPAGSKLDAPKAEEVGHMLFGSAKRQSVFATHPPLSDRIRALDPTFDPAQLDALAQQWAQSPPVGMEEDLALGLAPASPAQGTPPPPAELVGHVANPTEASYQHASALLERIPEHIRVRARSVDHAIPLVLGLLLSHDPQVREQQIQTMASLYGDAVMQDAEALSKLDPVLRLPLAELAFPALRHRTQAEQVEVLNAIHNLIHADGRIDTFEYCLSAMVHNDLYQYMSPQPRWHNQRRSLPKSRAQASTLLAVLAQVSGEQAAGAYQAGMAIAFPGAPSQYNPPAKGVLELESAWDVLRELNAEGKEQLIRATVATISHDKAIAISELELLRTVCAILQCPMPAFTSQ